MTATEIIPPPRIVEAGIQLVLDSEPCPETIQAHLAMPAGCRQECRTAVKRFLALRAELHRHDEAAKEKLAQLQATLAQLTADRAAVAESDDFLNLADRLAKLDSDIAYIQAEIERVAQSRKPLVTLVEVERSKAERAAKKIAARHYDEARQFLIAERAAIAKEIERKVREDLKALSTVCTALETIERRSDEQMNQIVFSWADEAIGD